MSQFKNNPQIKLFYTETDSIYTNLNPDELNSIITNIVDNKTLGKLKLESISKNVIFIKPKCYSLISCLEIMFIIKLINSSRRLLTVLIFIAFAAVLT